MNTANKFKAKITLAMQECYKQTVFESIKRGIQASKKHIKLCTRKVKKSKV